jgi:hypothetical protein
LKNIGERCDQNVLGVVDSGGGRYDVLGGQISPGLIPVASEKIPWFCGSSSRQLSCPMGTTHLRVSRPTPDVHFTCYAFQATPTGTTSDACSAEQLAVFRNEAGTGPVTVIPKDNVVTRVPLDEGRFRWACGSAPEQSSLHWEISLGVSCKQDGGSFTCGPKPGGKPPSPSEVLRFLGAGDDFTTCPQGTNVAYIQRHRDNRRFDVRCWYEPRP